VHQKVYFGHKALLCGGQNRKRLKIAKKVVVVYAGMCWKKNPWVGATFFSAHPHPPMKHGLPTKSASPNLKSAILT
jgi:hypothetical protein